MENEKTDQPKQVAQGWRKRQILVRKKPLARSGA
jgi:hypothetical protein